MSIGFSIDAEKCTECMRCAVACAMVKTGYVRPLLSRITIRRDWPKIPEIGICRFSECQEKPCLSACPSEAIYSRGDYILIDEEACIRCGACVSACPYGGIVQNEKTLVAIKCDFCAGDPACVRECFTGALVIKEAE